MKTSITVPGQIVINVFSTKRVSKLILFKAPILREEASVNSRLCNSITRAIRYNLRNIGKDNKISTGTTFSKSSDPSYFIVYHVKWKFPGIGCTTHTKSSVMSWESLFHDIAIRQSSTQLSTANN